MNVKPTVELAMEYFPDCSKEYARRMFTKMIRKNKDLSKLLEQTYYRPGTRFLTPRQQELIIEYLGEP